MANSNIVNKNKSKNKSTKKSVKTTENFELKKTDNLNQIENYKNKRKALTQKEINKRKYENSQKAYRTNRKKKTENKKGNAILEELPTKDNIKKKIVPKEVLTKESVKENTTKNKKRKQEKENSIKKDIEEIKAVSSDTYKAVKEKTSDKSIPLGKNKEDKKKRKKRYLKEALVFALIITFINLLSYVLFEYVNLLRIFDIKIFNVLATMIASFIISFIFSFIIDYIVSEIWVIFKRKRTGDANGDKGIKSKEYKKNIINKKRK